MKNLIFTLSFLLTTNLWAITTTQQGSAETSYVASTSCWSACYNAKNKAVNRINAVATNLCPGGYTITKAPTCSWPRQDDSYVDWGTYWAVCKCSVTCDASFTCNQKGQFPNFLNAGNGFNKQVLAHNMSRAMEVENSFQEMNEIKDPETMTEYLVRDLDERGLNTKPAIQKLLSGDVIEIQSPSAQELNHELDHMGIKVESDCQKVKKVEFGNSLLMQ